MAAKHHVRYDRLLERIEKKERQLEIAKGLFMFHCQSLEHEDMGMMREFSVE